MPGICFDKRILGALAIVGVGVLVVAPQLILAVLPLLLVALCPLSMLFMGKAMMSGGRRQQPKVAEPIEASYQSGPALERDQQAALLQVQLQTMRDQQTALVQQLAQLQKPLAIPLPKATTQDANDGAQPASASGV
jgi:hypothetical protein